MAKIIKESSKFQYGAEASICIISEKHRYWVTRMKVGNAVYEKDEGQIL